MTLADDIDAQAVDATFGVGHGSLFAPSEDMGEGADDDGGQSFVSALLAAVLEAGDPSEHQFHRFMRKQFYYNATDSSDFTSNYVPPKDITVNAVWLAIKLNALAFVFLMVVYETLRRVLPNVYSSRVKRQMKAGITSDIFDDSLDGKSQEVHFADSYEDRGNKVTNRLRAALPNVYSSNFWVPAVYSVSWNQVRRVAGLDAYFFLRFIRMNLRICAVTFFWSVLILVPAYATGVHQNNEVGWYHYSAANVHKDSWRMWVPSIFAYLFSAFIFFVMKQEYKHYVELRMDFLASGSDYVIPQQHYSIKVESIPYELRSQKALFDYFNQLFPGKVFSASVVLNLPDLEGYKNRCLRVCRRLEKSIAFHHATGTRASHTVGRPRMRICGIDLSPFDWPFWKRKSPIVVEGHLDDDFRIQRGTHVDSISYYVNDLASNNKAMFFMQQQKAQIAITGNKATEAETWLSRALSAAYRVADQIMVDSVEDNGLRAYQRFHMASSGTIPQAENMTSRYGSFGPLADLTPDPRTLHRTLRRSEVAMHDGRDHSSMSLSEAAAVASQAPPITPTPTSSDEAFDPTVTRKRPSEEELLSSRSEASERIFTENDYVIPGSTGHKNYFRKLAGRMGLDFLVAGFKFFNHQIDQALEGVVGATMSSTGFVTFLDLTSVATAATAPLTAKPQVLNVSVAPEPRDIVWTNAHISSRSRERREQVANMLLSIGVVLWIFPLTAIQAFANAEYLARIRGMEWIKTFDGGQFFDMANGYLPVVALLILISILPVLFQLIAIKYERRATFSDVQNSIMGRYFYYQVVNIYVSVTAGTIWNSLAEILDHPSSVLELLGESMPTMVGYFVSLLMTKILAGLPIVFLRFGALSRFLFLRTLSSKEKLTQREMDEIYRPENVQYGWEFPSQLLVIMIVFTYAVICPVIVPFGMLYFCGSLLVYKKQVLYVYQSVYESGGAMFPTALQRTLFGLVCGQCTLIGYMLTRGCYYQPVFLLPLPMLTVWGMQYFDKHYAEPSTTLSLERAREYDRVNEKIAKGKLRPGLQDLKAPVDDVLNKHAVNGIDDRRAKFDKDAYQQPVLTQKSMLPRYYRKGVRDTLTEDCRIALKEAQNYTLMSDDGRSPGIVT